MSNFIGFFVMTLVLTLWFITCVGLVVLAGVHESFLYAGACVLVFCSGMALIYCSIFAKSSDEDETERPSEGKEASK